MRASSTSCRTMRRKLRSCKPMKLLMVSLGCDKNLVDSEKMTGLLVAKGFVLTDDEEEAEVAVINTCCFIDDAKKESIDRIFELAKLKETGRLKVLIAAGCMAQRYRNEILEEIPELDGIVGTSGIGGIVRAVEDALRGMRSEEMCDISTDPVIAPESRALIGASFSSYLKIAEGCDKYCSYCAIPAFRGHYRSYPMEALLKEASLLASRGVRELILVAQETTLYGVDLYGSRQLHILLKKLCAIEGLHWIRVLYCYPEEIYPELIETIAEEPKICHYLDLPIQHAADSVLKRMNRRTTNADLRTLVRTLRERIPDIALRTTLITGFPGETEEEHRELLAFVKEMQFDRLGVFQYSREEGTRAADMKPQIKKSVKKQRYGEIMEAQQKISLKKNLARKGEVMEVLVEGSIPEDQVCIGRTYMDAPNVDGFFFFQPKRGHMSGDFIRALVTAGSEYDLHGEELDEQSLSSQ